MSPLSPAVKLTSPSAESVDLPSPAAKSADVASPAGPAAGPSADQSLRPVRPRLFWPKLTSTVTTQEAVIPSASLDTRNSQPGGGVDGHIEQWAERRGAGASLFMTKLQPAEDYAFFPNFPHPGGQSSELSPILPAELPR